MIVTICYFLKSIKSVFILVLSKNYAADSITVVCVMVEFEEKSGLSVLSGSPCV